MLNSKELIKFFIKKKIKFFSGVPDSLLKNFILELDKSKKIKHYICVNEGSAVGLAIGNYLKSRQISLVYFQNSGLGNAINPIVSIADKNVYKIPLVFLIGWRGSPGTKDEEQHLTKGKMTLPILQEMGIKYKILNNLSDLMSSNLIEYAINKSVPVAFLIKKNTIKISENTILKPKKYNAIERSNFISELLNLIEKNDRIISATGYTSRELYQIRSQRKIKKGKDFYMVGGMGHTSIVSLGYSLKNKQKGNTICLDGDGSFLMHMGSFVTIARYAKENYKYILLNNYSHESVGGQKTFIENINIKQFSKLLNFRNYFKINKKSNIKTVLKKFLKQKGPNFLEVEIQNKSLKDLKRPKNFKKILSSFIKVN